MTHGFAIVVLRSNFILLDKETDLFKPNKSITSVRLSANLHIYISVPKNTLFVQNWIESGWAYIGIGDSTLSSALRRYFKENDEIADQQQKASDIDSIITNNPGQYCGVLYNENLDQLIQITDPFACRSLFVINDDNFKIVASSLPIIKEVISSNYLKPNEVGNQFLLRYAYCLPGETIFKNIYEIEPKKIVSENVATPKTIWKKDIELDSLEKIDNKSSDKYNSNEYERELYERLLIACKQQVGEVNKVGVLLGGFDSALVASLIKKLDVEVETYSFYYNDKRYNQPYLDEFTSKLEIKHRWIRIDPNIIKNGLNQYGGICNWPTLWLNYVIQTQYLCNQMIENSVEVCFSGDGCDSAFLGYPSTHRRGSIYKRFPRVNPVLSSLLKNTIHTLRLEFILGHIARVMLSIIDASQHNVDKRPLYSFQIFNNSSYRRLTGKTPINASNHNRYFRKTLKQIESLSYERKVYFAKNLISPNRCKIVSSSDVSGLVVCSPYLHPIVRSYAQQLPDEVLRPADSLHSKDGKYILMKMADNYKLLPRKIIYQKKLAAIKSPIDEWLSNDLNHYVVNKLSSLPFKYNESYVNNLMSDKITEKIYKKYFSEDGVVSLAPSLLITFASLFE